MFNYWVIICIYKGVKIFGVIGFVVFYVLMEK